ncbi:hypothetical protein DFJ74DRAFT_399485, partial [Hyaloraphidium curvatum]
WDQAPRQNSSPSLQFYSTTRHGAGRRPDTPRTNGQAVTVKSSLAQLLTLHFAASSSRQVPHLLQPHDGHALEHTVRLPHLKLGDHRTRHLSAFTPRYDVHGANNDLQGRITVQEGPRLLRGVSPEEKDSDLQPLQVRISVSRHPRGEVWDVRLGEGVQWADAGPGVDGKTVVAYFMEVGRAGPETGILRHAGELPFLLGRHRPGIHHPEQPIGQRAQVVVDGEEGFHAHDHAVRARDVERGKELVIEGTLDVQQSKSLQPLEPRWGCAEHFVKVLGDILEREPLELVEAVTTECFDVHYAPDLDRQALEVRAQAQHASGQVVREEALLLLVGLASIELFHETKDAPALQRVDRLLRSFANVREGEGRVHLRQEHLKRVPTREHEVQHVPRAWSEERSNVDSQFGNKEGTRVTLDRGRHRRRGQGAGIEGRYGSVRGLRTPSEGSEEEPREEHLET